MQHGLIGLHDINLWIRFPQSDFVGPKELWEEARGNFPHMEIANVRHEDPGVGLFWIN